MERTKEDILHTNVTIIPNSNGIVYSNGSASYTQLSVTLKDALVDIPNKYMQTLEAISNMEYHSEEQCRAKACVPRYYIAGTFPVPTHNGQFTIKDSNIINPTNMMAVDIDKKDKNTLYAIRRLARWKGDVYVREPSGSGYWANISVSYNQKHRDLVIPVTFTIIRVEGGM